MDVRTVTDEAEAALSILRKARAGLPIPEGDWGRLFATEGYRRLEHREVAMGRSFEKEAFREFLLSPPTVAAEFDLASTIADWRRADLRAAARAALAYLPPGTPLDATIYPVIKPLPNSFVFLEGSRPGIFMFVDPAVSRAKLENTLAHELHHIGLSSACAEEADPDLPEEVMTAATWASAFGEGLAMLAAAGGPDVHPHAVSPAEERMRWDRDIAVVESDLRRVEAFFMDVIEGRLVEPEAVPSAGMAFFGEQGPWYTVGWTMGATVERVFGRERLVAEICDSLRLLATYNAAAGKLSKAGKPLPIWSPELIASLGL